MQPSLPLAFWNWPVLHSVQLLASEPQNEPGGHATQLAAPLALARPALQAAQAVPCAAPWNLPASQLEHDAAPMPL
jgi:hypothetical protein